MEAISYDPHLVMEVLAINLALFTVHLTAPRPSKGKFEQVCRLRFVNASTIEVPNCPPFLPGCK